jgi:hypothetical protein
MAIYLLGSGRGWSGSVTYGFPTAGSSWPSYPSNGAPFDASFATLSAHEQAQIQLAMQAWDLAFRPDLIAVNEPTQTAQIRFAFTSPSLSFTGSAPSGVEQAADGDIWLPAFLPDSSFDPLSPSTQFGALLWRIGLALGLSSVDGAGGGSLESYLNGHFTVMTGGGIADDVRWTVDPTGPGGPHVTDEVVMPTTPMVLDDYALMKKYGAPVASPGDTTYTWSQDHALMMTIVDSGGNDTIDLSRHTLPSIIDLTPASYSSIDYYPADQQLADLTARYPALAAELATRFGQNQTYTGTQNLGIAFGTIIENVHAGAGNDTIVGNTADNGLFGGAGDDAIDGGDGANYLRGDEGDDSITGGSAFDDINGNMGNDTLHGGAGDDWVVGGKDNDLQFGDAGGDVVWGNLGNDTLDGGDGADHVRGGQGDDSVSGGAGDDYVSGDRGADTITGGAGADLFHGSQDAGIDRVLDFHLSEGDRVMLDPGTSYTVSQVGADTVIDMGAGNQMILVGVQLSTLTPGWIFGA